MLMTTPGKVWEMPTYKPSWNMRIVAHGYAQWVHDGRPPTIEPDFMDKIMVADMEAISHFRYIDDQIEFEKDNPGKAEMDSILRELGYE